MATLVFKNAFVEINGTDVSDDVSEVALNYSSEMLDETAMGDDTRIHKGGLYDWSWEATFHHDATAGHADNLLFALVGTTSCFELRPNYVCSTTANPRFTGIAVLENYPPLAGPVGSLLDTKASFRSASSLSRAVSAT